MTRFVAPAVVGAVLIAVFTIAQTGSDPFPTPIHANTDVVTVSVAEFASLPWGGDEPPRMMLLVNEPGTARLFVNTMQGVLYSVSYNGRSVIPYLDIGAATWGVGVESEGDERGFQSFAFHPEFNQPGARGFGKFYTYTDTTNMTPKPDFRAGTDKRTHDTVLLEWTAKSPSAATYDGGPPRELFRAAHPFSNHNGGMIAFNPNTPTGSADFGLLYVGVADGGSGGDPFNNAQNLKSAFGKILRIDPLGRNSVNGRYGIPSSNPFVGRKADALGEIFAYGVRNPQRFSWDSKNGNMFLADIGQNIVEEIDLVTAGANLGWNKWEGSFTYGSLEVGTANPRGDPRITYPVVEFDHKDPLLRSPAVTGVYVNRQTAIPQLAHLLIFGDNPSGELFYVDADQLPQGGQDAIRRILLKDRGVSKTLLQLIRGKNRSDGMAQTSRADLRLGVGPEGQIFILNKHDATIRLMVPDDSISAHAGRFLP